MQYEIKLILLMVPVFVFLFYFSQTKNSSLSVLVNIYLILIIGLTLFSIGKYVYVNYHEPPKWDFQVFWLNGRVGVEGLNFYMPENYHKMAQTLKSDEGFTREILDVGFWYPPMSMFLFAPLGWFELSTAYVLWQAANLVIFSLCIYGLWSLFLKDHRMFSLLLVAMLMLMLVPTRTTFTSTQTNFLNLLFFLMFWQNRSKGMSGIWLALCVVVKPFTALLYLYPLLTGKWRVFATAILALLIITFLSFIVFGSDVFVSFLNHPIPNMPNYMYFESVSQSLLAMILRLTPNQIISESPLLNPWYLGISVLLTLITVWVTTMKKNNDDWVVLSILFLALLVYPTSEDHYGVFLIIPVVLLLRQSSQGLKERTTIFFIIFLTYFLSGHNSGSYTFYANLFMWLVCIILGAKSNNELYDEEPARANDLKIEFMRK